jgi:hypothetical protein
MEAEVHDRRTYVLDTRGTVWEWSFRDYRPYIDLAMFCLPALGLGLGALVAVTVEAFAGRRRQVPRTNSGS